VSPRSADAGEFLRNHGVGLAVGVALLGVAVFSVRWIASNRAEGPPPRKVMQFSVVNIQPSQPPPPPPPPPPTTPAPAEVDEPEVSRVNIRPVDLPPDAPPPSGPAAGPLALATEGTGPGDAFNLAGNPGGRGLLSGGGLGDGSGVGGGGGDAAARYAWYYGKMQPDVEAALRRNKRLNSASVRIEARIWWDESGRITRVQAVRSSGDPSVDAALQDVVGVSFRQTPPADLPMPFVVRINARRPQ
jgi:TonB family protein